MILGEITYLNSICEVHLKQYASTNLNALQLLDNNDGMPVCVASINIPDVELNKNEVLIKNYSENEGILDVLVDAGFIKNTGKTIKQNFVEIPVCEILM